MNGDSAQTSQPQRIHERLAGHEVLVTGSTGFLAKAFIEKLLRSVESIGGIHLLVRTRPGGPTPRQRLMKEVLGSRAFDRLRASLGEAFTERCEQKIHVIAGDLTRDRFGLSREAYDSLVDRITLVVNSAATVTFDERLDLAVELNTVGPTRLLRFAKDCGHVPFLHVSTCYVAGQRRGVVVEDFSAPERARESLPRLPDGSFDLDGLVESMRATAAELRHRFGADTEHCRKQLVDAGMRMARSYGWNDTYTFTKWVGEQLLVRDRGDVPLVVFRPAIIEGSYEEPIPGWIDGLRMADPIIVAYGRGKLNEFPGLAHVPIDLIPVDFVANAMIATLPVGSQRQDRASVYHCASSDRNRFNVGQMCAELGKAFHRRPFLDDNHRSIRVGPLMLVDQEQFLSRVQRKRTNLARLQRVLHAIGIRGRRYRRVSGLARQIDQLSYFARIYAPYTHLDCRFSDDELQRAREELHPDDRAAFPFDVADIDWQDYIVNRHVPGLRSFVLGSAGETSPRILAADEWSPDDIHVGTESLKGANLFDVFQRAARQRPDKPALQIKREGRWLRYTYEEALRATGAIVMRFVERGLQPGDGLAICGESCPEWGLTYLAAMRAGLTAIPLDPQLPPSEAWSAAAFAGTKLMCATPATARGLSDARQAHDADFVVIGEPFIPRPSAARDAAPDPVPVDQGAVASILFTSGTTVSPKAVQLTHANLLANANALMNVHPVLPTDQLLSVLPLHHVFEFTGGFLMPLVSGATITYVEQLKGPELLAAMHATGTTIMLVVPRLLRMFLDSIQTTVASSGVLKRLAFRVASALSELSGNRWRRFLFRAVHKRFGGRLHMFVSGGSRLDPDLFRAFRRLGFDVYEGYGLTETAPVLTLNPRGKSKSGSVGPPLPGVDMEIRNRNLEDIGEVWVRGPNVMPGYLHNPKATREVLVDGWFRTGDLGWRDEDDYLYLTGRTKDLIVTGAGKNVYPDEVEHRYRSLPFTKELCVFGMPAEDGLGDIVHAVVVLDQDAAPDLDQSSLEREVRAAVADMSEKLPSHERITTLHFWDCDLPRTSTLKAKRGVIRAMIERDAVNAYASGEGNEAAAGKDGRPDARHEGVPFDLVRRIVAAQTNRSESVIDPSQHLHLDLGIDSIGKMDLLCAVEEAFGMQIDTETAGRIARVSDLLKLVADRSPKGRGGRHPVRTQRSAESRAARTANGTLPHLLPFRWFVRSGISAFMHSYVRVHVRGRENVPASGAFVVAPNHSSHLDSPAVLTAVGGKRRVWIAGAEDYFFNSRLKRIVFGQLLDTIPFDRKSDGILGLRRCGDALIRGDGLLIFPEGTRSTTGTVQPFKIGVALLAMDRGVPIVPVFIDRTFDLLAKGRRFVRPGSVTVTFGKPIHPPQPDEYDDRHDALRALARRVEEAVVSLADGAAVP